MEALKKYQKGLSGTLTLFSLENGKVLKTYLMSKKVRMITFFRSPQGVYVPVWILRKETKMGMNITKDDESYIMRKIDHHIEDIMNGDFKEYKM